MRKRIIVLIIIAIILLLMFWWHGRTATSPQVMQQSAVQSTRSVVAEKAKSIMMTEPQKKSATKLPLESRAIKSPDKRHQKIAKKKIVPMTLKQPQYKNAGGPWVSVGYGQIYLDNPKFSVGSQTESSPVPYKTIDNKGWTSVYNVAAGYQFNTQNKWMNRLFGAQPVVLLQMNYQPPSSAEENTAASTGELYKITGGLLTDDSTLNDLRNTALKAKTKALNFGVYLSGHKQTRWNRLSFNPYIGLTYNESKDQFDFSSEYSVGEDFVTDEENYRLKTQQYGVSGGSQFNYQMFKKMVAFLNIQLQLLHAVSNLNADQTYDGGSPLPVSISLSDRHSAAVTYRGMIAAGASYYFSTLPNSMALSLMGGVDHYGYAAEIVTPHANSDSAAHLSSTGKNNAFVMLKLSAPLPFLS